MHPALGPKDRGTIVHYVFGTHLKFLRSLIWAECFKDTILSSDLQNIRYALSLDIAYYDENNIILIINLVIIIQRSVVCIATCSEWVD